jgi:Na+/H+ antiporter NhaC
MLIIIPPAILIATFILSKNIHISLIAGLATASIINFHGVSIDSILSSLLENFRIIGEVGLSPNFIKLVIFLAIFAWFSEIIIKSNVISTFKNILKSLAKNKKNLEKLIIKSGWIFFIDDYLSILSLKSLYSSLLKNYGIAKEKFSYLTTSTTPAITTLSIISSWGAFFMGALSEISHQYGTNPLYFYIHSLCFAFYPIISIFTSWYIVDNQISFGPIQKHENESTGDIIVEAENKQPKWSLSKIALDIILFILPFIGIIFEITSAIIYKYQSPNAKNFSSVLTQIDLNKILAAGAIKGFMAMITIMFIKKRISIKILFSSFTESIKTLISPIAILVLAGSFSKAMINNINIDTISTFIIEHERITLFLPAIFNALVIVLSLIFSSSWAVMLMLTPIVLLIKQQAMWPVIIGSILSGVLSGGLLAPGSDTINISSGSLKIPHRSTYISQLPYNSIGTIACFMSYIIFGILSSYMPQHISIIASWPICILLTIILIEQGNKYFKYIK